MPRVAFGQTSTLGLFLRLRVGFDRELGGWRRGAEVALSLVSGAKLKNNLHVGSTARYRLPSFREQLAVPFDPSANNLVVFVIEAACKPVAVIDSVRCLMTVAAVIDVEMRPCVRSVAVIRSFISRSSLTIIGCPRSRVMLVLFRRRRRRIRFSSSENCLSANEC